jgi:hypothetical protein
MKNRGRIDRDHTFRLQNPEFRDTKKGEQIFRSYRVHGATARHQPNITPRGFAATALHDRIIHHVRRGRNALLQLERLRKRHTTANEMRKMMRWMVPI